MIPLIFKTNIESSKALSMVDSAFKSVPEIKCWHVDTQDIDRVLRIELKNVLSEVEIIRLLKQLGLQCEVLED